MSSSSLIYQTATDGTTVTFDFSKTQNWQVTLGGSRTFAFQGAKSGDRVRVKVKQDATGSRTVTWPSTVIWAGGSAPTLTTTASRTDIVEFEFDGTNYVEVSNKLNYTGL